jgi:hypothetical protein
LLVVDFTEFGSEEVIITSKIAPIISDPIIGQNINDLTSGGG